MRFVLADTRLSLRDSRQKGSAAHTSGQTTHANQASCALGMCRACAVSVRGGIRLGGSHAAVCLPPRFDARWDSTITRGRVETALGILKDTLSVVLSTGGDRDGRRAQFFACYEGMEPWRLILSRIPIALPRFPTTWNGTRVIEPVQGDRHLPVLFLHRTTINETSRQHAG